MAFLLKDQRLPTRQPIGKTTILKSAPASAIAEFYARWYRPDRAVLVAAGDFDVEEMDAKIRKVFGGWAAKGPSPADPDPGSVAARAMTTQSVVASVPLR